MLDIKYFKQIDKELEVEGFELDTGLVHDYYLVDPDGDVHPLTYLKEKKTAYGHYLTRVIEAINKKYNEDDNYFNYRIIQKDDLIEVLFINEHCESYSGLTDESKESAIQYIMDHIKEKV